MIKIRRFVAKLFSPIGLIFKELKLVEWLSFKQTAQSTLLILVICAFVGIIIVAFDTVLFNIRNVIIDL
jgi:preprotein translocase SecE subunit